MLHSQIQSLILHNLSQLGKTQVLILISGDGNANNNRTSFPDVVTTALEHGWIVEIWSWKASLSTKFLNIQQKYPAQMKIEHLDIYRSKITFKQNALKRQTNRNIQCWSISILGLLSCLLILVYYFKTIHL